MTEGTRFLLYPQYDEGFAPESVAVSCPAGSVGPGPADGRMVAVNPVRKDTPYAPPDTEPPFRGATLPPAIPDACGHFDRVPPDTPQFQAAHLFGTVRFALDVWERASGEALHWWHPDAPARLELIPLVWWRNAQSGPGYLETGVWPAADGRWQPFCLNFDVVAHETGHAILFGRMGAPERVTGAYLGLHEAFADLFAIMAALHFPSVRARLLAQTQGNLYALNLLNRLGETAPHQQIRLASNDRVMADVADVWLAPDGEWIDARGLGRNAHALAEPLTGAVFDVLVELFQAALAQMGLIAPARDPRGWTAHAVARFLPGLRREHARARQACAAGFDAALFAAGEACLAGLVAVATTLEPDAATFDRAAARLLEGVTARGWGELLPALLACFERRGIAPGPHLLLHERKNGSRDRAPLLHLARTAARPCDCTRAWHVGSPRHGLAHAHRAL